MPKSRGRLLPTSIMLIDALKQVQRESRTQRPSLRQPPKPASPRDRTSLRRNQLTLELSKDDATYLWDQLPAHLVPAAYTVECLQQSLGWLRLRASARADLPNTLKDLESWLSTVADRLVALVEEKADSFDSPAARNLCTNVEELAQSLEACLDDESLFEDVVKFLGGEPDGDADTDDWVLETAENFRLVCQRTLEFVRGSASTPGQPSKWTAEDNPSGIQQPKLLAEAIDRSLALVVSDRLDPNERCAAVTIALAGLVNPAGLQLVEDGLDGSLRATFGKLYVRLLAADRGGGLSFSRVVPACSGNKLVWLDNLALTYDDHLRNIEARGHLARYLALAPDAPSKAGVLGIAWCILQRKEVRNVFPINRSLSSLNSDESGLWLSGDNGVTIRVANDRVFLVAYPGLPS